MSDQVSSVVLCAPAKINLYLSVGETRPDGYHTVRTVSQALQLCDRVTVTPSDALEVLVEPALDVPVRENTAYRAAVAMAELVDAEPAVKIRVEKSIPHAAGLGGGSADAAAVVWALSKMWAVDPTGDRAMRAAAEVGADVPFFLVGGAALLDRRGDRLVRTLPSLDADIVLVNPGVPTSTPEVYRAFDRLKGEETGSAATAGIRALTDAMRQRDVAQASANLHNGLATAAIAVSPEISTCREWLAEQPGVFAAQVAGSGATVYGLCSDTASAAAAREAADAQGWWSVATHTRDAGVGPVTGDDPR